jgi:hypothetical protein
MSTPFGLSPIRVFAILLRKQLADRENAKRSGGRLTGTPDSFVFVNQVALRTAVFPTFFAVFSRAGGRELRFRVNQS